jgi:hypothetical protein
MKLRVERVDGVLERLNLRRRDAQDRPRRLVRLARNAEVGAEVEQIVLDSRQHRFDCEIGCIACIAHRKQREADGAIRFINVAHGCDARIALRTSGAIAKPGFALVPGARIDDVELDHAFPASARGGRAADAAEASA